MRRSLRPIMSTKVEPPKRTASKVCASPASAGQDDKNAFAMQDDKNALVANDDNNAFVVVPDLTSLFPSGKMFNVSMPARGPAKFDNGVGNWLKVRMPIEYEGIREEIEFKLTAKEAFLYNQRY